LLQYAFPIQAFLLTRGGTTPRLGNFFLFIILMPAKQTVKRPRPNPVRNGLEDRAFIAFMAIVCQSPAGLTITFADDSRG